MIAFLVFSDWANPSQTPIEKTSTGTRMQVAGSARRKPIASAEEPLGELESAKLTLNRNEIASETDFTPPNYQWAA